MTSRFATATDPRTRVMLFAMDLKLQPGETLSAVTAEAEDAAHRIYELRVEHLGPVPNQEWLSAVVLRLNDNMTEVGDVLVRVSYNGVISNRVRIGIGHTGGGPPDDQEATPTPVKPYTLGGQLRDDKNQGIDGIQVSLADTTDGTTKTLMTSGGGQFSFSDVAPGHSFIVTPSASDIFEFNPQIVDLLMSDRLMEFKAKRRVYSVSGKLTGALSRGTVGATVSLTGFYAANTWSDANGNYSFAGVPAGGDYTITVTATPYYTFTPQTLTNLRRNASADFAGALRSYTVSGRAQLGPNAASFIDIPFSGSTSMTLVADADGRYSVTLPAGGTYTITPSLRYYDFGPPTQYVNDLTSDQINRNFTGIRQLHTLSGRVVDQSGNGLPGITVQATGAPLFGLWERVSAQNGYYEFAGLPAGYDYTLTPNSNSLYRFHASSVVDLSNNQTIDFTGLRRLTIAGRVRDETGTGILGLTVTLTGTETATAVTAPDGSYSLTATATGNYTVTPAIPQGWYTFAPASAQFNNLAGSQALDFTATLRPVSNPAYVLEFDASPKSVDYGNFWQQDVELGHFYWEFWAMPGSNAGATYLLSDGYGGAHALLFGVGSFNSSEPNRYELLGNIFDGVKFDNYFGSDQGPAVGEWAHFGVGWDGQNIITYYNGVPVGKTPFAGPRRTPGPGGGGGRLLIGGSDHSNFDGRIAQVRGYEDTNPREAQPGGVESAFAPQTIFSLGGNLLSYYFRQDQVVADLSTGYRGASHQGWVRGTRAGIIFDCGGCPPPQFVIDPSAPSFATNTPPAPIGVPPPAAIPSGALVFDSFARANSTYLFGSKAGLGATEGGSSGTQVWQTGQPLDTPQPFGILNSIAVPLANSAAVAWVPTGSDSIAVRVERRRGRWGRGIHTGLSFRVVDAKNFFFAYTSDVIGAPGSQQLKAGYYLNDQRIDLTTGVAMPSTWTTLRVITLASGELQIYADNTLVYSTISSVLTGAKAAGLYHNSGALGLANRWDNFAVFAAR